MTELRVWAPDRRHVEAVLDDDRRVTLAPAEGGWWAAAVEGLGHGGRYRFSLDGGEPRPDPRSPWQPGGIDGPSAVVDHTRFAWTDGQWKGTALGTAVLYELHVGTFSQAGTFDGAVEHLEHLVELGVDAVKPPVAEFSGDRGWGYDGVLLYAPHHAYGGPDGMKRFVDACHARGLAVVLDVVYNHLGPAGNHLGQYGPYFTDKYRTPWGEAVNYDDADSDEVRGFVLDNVRQWLVDYHLDGLRLDAVHAIHDEGAVHLLEVIGQVARAVAAETGRERWIIAESDLNDPRLVRPADAGGYGLDATWSDDFHHALHALLTGERGGYYADFGSVAQLARALEQVYVYGRDYSPSRRRTHGRPVGDLGRDRFLGYLQNHDQIGNRALGERAAALMSPGRVRIGAALVLTAPFVPMLFQGEEWAASTPWQYFTDHRDPELGRAVSEGRRREFEAFGWEPDSVPDPQDPATFARSRLDWTELSAPAHAHVLTWHRQLMALRHRQPELRDPDARRTQVRWSDHERWLVLWRGEIAVAVNLAEVSQRVPLDLAGSGGTAAGRRVLLSSAEEVRLAEAAVELPPESVAVVAPG